MFMDYVVETVYSNNGAFVTKNSKITVVSKYEVETLIPQRPWVTDNSKTATHQQIIL